MHQLMTAGFSPPQKRRNPAGGNLNGVSSKSFNVRDISKSGRNKPYLSFSDIRFAAYGRWEYIHGSLGIKIVSANYRKHTVCPGCGGTDRFHVERDYNETGHWFCRQGGTPTGGDGFSLLGHVFGWNPQEQLKSVAVTLGLSTMDNNSYLRLKEQADKQKAKMAEDARRKDEQARRDSNMLIILEDLIDSIRNRQYLQKSIHKTSGFFILMPTEDEIEAVKELITTAIDCYSDFIKGADHD